MTINNFGPFNVEIWGTVSDWCIVIVTIITAYSIWRTLHEQVIISKVSINKDKRDIRPEFKITYNSEESNFKLYVTNATANKVLIFNTDTYGKTLDEGEPEQNIKVWHKKYNKVLIPHLILNREYSIWTIRFEDEDGREYKQEISGDNDGVFIDFPLLIKDVF